MIEPAQPSLRGRVGWAVQPGDPKGGPRPIIVVGEEILELIVFFGTSNVHKANATIIAPATRIAAAWLTSSRPLTGPTAFYPELQRVLRTTVSLPFGGAFHARPLAELEAKVEALALVIGKRP